MYIDECNKNKWAFLKIVLGSTTGTPWTADEGEGCTLDFIKVLKSIDFTISKVSTEISWKDSKSLS